MKLLKQFGIIMGVYVFCEILLNIINVRFPANVLGMIVLFILLCTKVIKLEQIEDVSNFLTSNMAFFFIPAGASIAKDLGIVKDSFFPILIICILGTAIVFGFTVYTARLIQKIQFKREVVKK